MPEVVGVRFKPSGKIYTFEVNGIDIKVGDEVVVESQLGLTIGYVVKDRYTIEESDKNLKKIIRKVTKEDLEQKMENLKLEEEAMKVCLERIMARGLPMKLVDTEVTLDRKRLIFYFTAEKRIDFRELVKDLAAKFKTRIEMRQIGVRDGAKLIGSIGICGMEICCRKFLTSFEPISIKMAKKQELVLNTGKLSGICGRLMCCLGFEYPYASQEDITQTDAEEFIVEEAEETEMVVASSESIGIEDASEQQLIKSESPQPVELKRHKEKHIRWPLRKRKKRRRHREG